jgi:hypothetical protein
MGTLLEGWDGMSMSKEEFIQAQGGSLMILDDNIIHAVQGRTLLVECLKKNESFKEQWTALTQESPKVAAACLARCAAFETGNGVEELFGVKNLICACLFGGNPEHKKVKWPIFPTLFPELSAWLLAPAKERTQQLFPILDYLCSDD